MIDDLLKKYPKVNLSFLPTPLHEIKKLTGRFGVNLYIKRDDLTGFSFGGNKTRKLDFLIADALKLKADTLIAMGANQSNFCRIAATAGVMNGLEVHLVLEGEKPGVVSGNLIVDHLLDVHIHHVGDMYNASLTLEKQLSSRGKTVYRMPWGGSSPVGILGYVDAFQEILTFEKEHGIHFDGIFFASGSGGTHAGLLLGKYLSGWTGRLNAISVSKQAIPFKNEVYQIVKETCDHLKINPPGKDEIFLDDSYLGESYGKKTPGCIKAVKLFAKEEGIFLDYVYTGKAAAGMIDYLEKGLLKKKANILFIHTGGNIELFE